MPTAAWLAVYGPEVDNVRAAVDWAFGPQGSAELGLRLLAFSWPLWAEKQLKAEYGRRLDLAMERVGPSTPPGIAARLHFGHVYRRTGLGLRSAVAHARQAVDLARAADEPILLTRTMTGLAAALLKPATLAEAKQLLQEALQQARARNHVRILSDILNTLGVASYLDSDPAAARHYYEESASYARLNGDLHGLRKALGNLAELCVADGDLRTGIATAREAIDAAGESDDLHTKCVLSANLAGYLLLQGETDNAARSAFVALTLAPPLGEEFVAAWVLQHLALIAARRGNLPVAAQLQGYVDAVYEAEHTRREGTEQATSDLALAALATGLPEDERARLAALGGTLTLDQAAALALGLAEA
jgi:hypothetical protein